MAGSGAHRVDNVLPRAPYRQWRVPLPWPLGRLFAAPPQGLLGVVTPGAVSGAVQGGGGAPPRGHAHRQGGLHTALWLEVLNLSVHRPVLALDGADTFAHGKAHCQRAPAPRANGF